MLNKVTVSLQNNTEQIVAVEKLLIRPTGKNCSDMRKTTVGFNRIFSIHLTEDEDMYKVIKYFKWIK